VETARDVRFKCRLCGGVRIPIDDAAIERSSAQIELLKRATVARTATAIWIIVAAVVAAFGLCSVLVLALVISVASPPTPAAVIGAVAAMVPFGFAGLAFRKSRAHQGDIARFVEASWIAAASDIARARGGEIDGPLLAKLTRTTEGEADQLLARMSSKSLLTSTVTPDGSLKYTLLDAGGESPRALASGN
jgi:hypothetical protein